jgi:hypothetical protein
MVIRLEPSVARLIRAAMLSPSSGSGSLRELTDAQDLTALYQFLDGHGADPLPLVRAVPPDRLAELEERAARGRWPVVPSLLDYWTLDARDPTQASVIRDIALAPAVARAYWEPRFSDPAVTPADDWLAATQSYLDAAPTGIDARYAWQKGLSGSGVGLVDLEMEWNPHHQDLRAHWTDAGGVFTNPLAYNDNYQPFGGYCGGHGTCVLGIVAGSDNTIGVVGIAPDAGPIRLVSRYQALSDTSWDVVNAIAYALDPANALLKWGDVLLLEVQTDNPPDPTSDATRLRHFPVEVVEHCLAAIRLAVGNGIHVIEPAGNGDTGSGGLDLDTSVFEQEFDRTYKVGDGDDSTVTLDRTKAGFRDSGAIVVAAAEAMVEGDGHPPHRVHELRQSR